MIFMTCPSASRGQQFDSAQVTSSILARVERSLPRNAAFRTSVPRYCLLIVGPTAKTHIWLILDGEILHVVRDRIVEERTLVTDPYCRKWRECLIGDVGEADSPIKHRKLTLIVTNDLATLTLRSDGRGMKDFRYITTNLTFAVTAQDAPVVHFNGPLQIRVFLTEEGPPYMLAEIGTEGIGDGSFASISKSVSEQISTRPVADILLGTKDGSTKRQQVVLVYEHCVDGFHGSVRVPPGIATGNAEVTVHFSKWKDGNLAPIALSIPVGRLEWR